MIVPSFHVCVFDKDVQDMCEVEAEPLRKLGQS